MPDQDWPNQVKSKSKTFKRKNIPESFLVTVQYERDKAAAEKLAKEIAEKGHTANVAQHQELYEPPSAGEKVMDLEEEKKDEPTK